VCPASREASVEPITAHGGLYSTRSCCSILRSVAVSNEYRLIPSCSSVSRTWSLNSSFSFVVIVSDFAMIGTMFTSGESRRRNSTSIALRRCGAMKYRQQWTRPSSWRSFSGSRPARSASFAACFS